MPSFPEWYADRSRRLGLNPNPDDPGHFYDYRAAYAAGAEPDSAGHWPSQFKRDGHPRLFVDGVDTRTGMPVTDGPDFTGLPEEIESVYRAAYPQPIQQPTYQPVARDHRLGPLRINGGALDSATLAVLQAMQNAPRATSGAGGFAQGLVSGFAGARGRQIGQRQKQFETAEQWAADEAEERRRFRSQAGASLAKGRWDLHRESKVAEAKAFEDTVESTPELVSRLRAQKIYVDPSLKRIPKSALVRDMPVGNPLLDQLRTLAIANFGKPKPESPAFKAMAYNTIADNVRQDKDVGPFVIVRDQYNNGMKALQRKNSFGDLLAMRFLARASDPETGIREEEFKTFKRAVGFLASKGIFITQEMWGNGMLNDKGREFVRQSLQDIYDTKLEGHNMAISNARAVAQELGLDPDLAVRQFVRSAPQPADNKAKPFDWDKP